MKFNQEQLLEALCAAFPNPEAAKQLLDRINRNWYFFAGQGMTLDAGFREVVNKAWAQGWLLLLLSAVKTSGSQDNEKFRRFLKDNPEVAAALAAPGRDRYLKRLLKEIDRQARLYSALETVADLQPEAVIDPYLEAWEEDQAAPRRLQ